MPKIENEEVIFTTPPSFPKLYKKFISQFPDALATPKVDNCEIWKSPSAPLAITDFLNGADGQDLFILGNGNLTITHGTQIKTSTGANKVLAANKIYHYKRIDHVWYEVTT